MRKRMLFHCCAALLLLVPAQVAGAQTAGGDLAHRAMAAIRDCTHFTIFDDVQVAVAAGEVTLTGWVTMPVKRQEIGALVEKLGGVTAVRNEIQVLPASPHDSHLRQKIARAIYDHPAFWRYASMSRPPIHIIVARGRVTLTGSVTSDTERMLAYTLAQVPAAVSVTNRLKIDSR
jgi:osmotically-inducible protein OsmY